MTSVSPRVVNRVAEAVEGVCVKNVAGLQTRDRRNGSIYTYLTLAMVAWYWITVPDPTWAFAIAVAPKTQTASSSA